MNPVEKLALLRAEMAKRHIDAYVVVTDDFHTSEYVGAHFKAREFLSGFTGSAGTLVVLPDAAALWTDGRYFLQASQQLEGSGIELMRMGQPGVPEIPAFLRDHVPENGWIGFDSRTISNDFARSIGEKTREKHIRFAGDEDLVDLVWADRPALSCEPVWELDVKYAGLTRREKLAMVRGKMKEMGASVFVIPSLDEVAWLLNLRGNDVLFTPVFLSYLLLEQDKATLCVQREAVSAEIEAHLKSDGVTLAPYDDIYRLVAALPTGTRVLLDGERANYRILQSVPESAEVLDRTSPIQLMKAVKTPAEQENERLAHIKDGVAVTRFIYWLKHTIGKEPITELSASKKLESLRAEGEHYLEQSFDPILAYGAHGAIVHYEPTDETFPWSRAASASPTRARSIWRARPTSPAPSRWGRSRTRKSASTRLSCADTYSWARPSSCTAAWAKTLTCWPARRCGKRASTSTTAQATAWASSSACMRALSAYTGT